MRGDTAGPGKELLTCCQAKRTRVGVRKVRRDTVGSGHDGITHILSSQQDKSGRSMVRRDTAVTGPGMESLTVCQTNRIKVGVRTVRRNIAGPSMKSLTSYQANQTRVEIRTVRWDIARQLYASNPVWHPPQYFSFQSFLVKFFCVDTVQLFIIYSAHHTILIHFPYLLTAYSIFSTILACWVDITSFCNSSSSSASDVLLKSGAQSAPS